MKTLPPKPLLTPFHYVRSKALKCKPQKGNTQLDLNTTVRNQNHIPLIWTHSPFFCFFLLVSVWYQACNQTESKAIIGFWNMDGFPAYKLFINKSISDKADSFLAVHTLSITTAEECFKPDPVYKTPKHN